MASEEELRRERELNELLSRRVGINRDIVDDLQDQTNVLNDQIKLLKFERSERSQIRSLTREINKIASDNFSIIAGELGVEKNLSKIRKDQIQLTKDLNSFIRLRNKLVDDGSQLNSDIVISLDEQIKFTKTLQAELQTVEEISNNIANNTTVTRFSNISTFLKSFGPLLKGFATPFERGAEAARESIIANTEVLKRGKGLTAEKMKELGLAERMNGIYGEYGVHAAKLTEEEKKAAIQRAASAVSAAEAFKLYSNLATNVVGISLLNSLFKVNKAQTDFRRLTGQSISAVDTLTASLITTTNIINQAVSATEQFGINAAVLFDNINLTEAAELSNLLGLTAQEANNLALASQSVGQSLNIAVENAIKQVNAVNATRKSAVSQKVVFQDIANISSDLLVAFNGQVDLLAEAAAEARALGLNLSQVNKIADSLIDIESSLTKEIEAQAILGVDINLDRARSLALTDNLSGLVKELRDNEQLLGAFVQGNRIERQVAAEVLGMSVEEMGKFVLLNQANLGITQQEAMAAAGVTEEQLKQLTIQESFNNSIEKLTSLLIAGVEPALSAIANNFTLIGGVLGTLAGLSLAKLITQLAAAAVQAGLIGAFTNPAGLLIGLGVLTAGLAAAGAIAANYAQKASKVQDGIAPADKGPFTITDKFGAMAITTPGDALFASPNISNINNLAPQNIIYPSIIEKEPTIPSSLNVENSTIVREERNINNTLTLTEKDIRAIANAVREGAMEGTSKANVQAVISNRTVSQLSSRIQPELAINTYRSAY